MSKLKIPTAPPPESWERSPVWLPLFGKRFEWGGRGPETFDCWGLCLEIYRRLGRELPPYSSHHECAEIHRKIQAAKAGLSSEAPGTFREIPGPEPWALATFIIRPPFTSHVGVVLPDRRRFIHIMEACRVAVERLDDPAWKRRSTGFFLPSGPGGAA